MDILKDCSEGELYILASQVKKIIRILKENSERAEQGKIFLADAMADISHQLKTPLTSINLVISFLGAQNLPDDRRYALARELNGLTNKIEWLVYALLRISKLDAGTVVFKVKKIPLKERLYKTII